VYYPPGSSVPAWRKSQANVEAEVNNLLARHDGDTDDVVGLFRPLDGIARANHQRRMGMAMSYEYYIQIVPTVLELYVTHAATTTASIDKHYVFMNDKKMGV
jgi:hypothetical protein